VKLKLRRKIVESQNLVLRSGYPAGSRFIFEFESEAAARSFFNCTPREALAVLQRWNCREAVARITGQPDIVLPLATVELMASAEPLQAAVAVQLFFADGSLPATVLRAAMDEMQGDSRWGIVRLSDQRQVVMSSGMSGVLLAGVGIEETTNWRRPEFWLPADLSDFTRDWQQQLGTDGRQMEYSYRIRRPGTSGPWERYTSRFRLLQGEDGLDYHLGVFAGRD
jgi:hypothetical protein